MVIGKHGELGDRGTPVQGRHRFKGFLPSTYQRFPPSSSSFQIIFIKAVDIMTLSSLIESIQRSDVEKESLVKSLDYYQVDPDKITITVDPGALELFVYPARKPVYGILSDRILRESQVLNQQCQGLSAIFLTEECKDSLFHHIHSYATSLSSISISSFAKFSLRFTPFSICKRF